MTHKKKKKKENDEKKEERKKEIIKCSIRQHAAAPLFSFLFNRACVELNF